MRARSLRSPDWVEIVSAQPALRPEILRELVQTKSRSSFRFAARRSKRSNKNVSLVRFLTWELVQTVPRCTGNSIALRFRAGHCVQAQPAAGRACRFSLPRDVRAGSACPRVHRYPIALRFPYYTELGHQNQHICLIFSNMCSILEPRALERRQIAAKLADRQSVHAGFGEDPGFCYHAGLPLLLEYKKLCPIIRTVPKFFPGVSSGTLGWRKKSGKIRCLSFLSRASRGF